MTVRPVIVRRRLAHLVNMLAHLEALREEQPSERDADPVKRLLAERALHVCAEVIFDIGHHILAGRGHAIPQTYGGVLPALAVAGVVEQALADRLDGLAGLRNILVHSYGEIDHAIIWQLIDLRLGDLHAMHAAFADIEELREG